MADKLFEDSQFYRKRFTFVCFDISHTVDISVELTSDGSHIIEVGFWETHSKYGLSFFERFKRAVKFLFGKEIYGHGFSIRGEDIPEMIEILQKGL